MEVHLLDRRPRSSHGGSCSGRSFGRTGPRCHTHRAQNSPGQNCPLCSRCHICGRSSLTSRGTSRSHDHSVHPPHSHRVWNSPRRTSHVYTLCGSGLRGNQVNTYIGLSQGRTMLRSYSHSGADRGDRRNHWDRHARMCVRRSPGRTGRPLSLCHMCHCSDRHISADSWPRICPRSTLYHSASQSNPVHRCSSRSRSHTVLHYCSYKPGSSLDQIGLGGSLVRSPVQFVLEDRGTALSPDRFGLSLNTELQRRSSFHNGPMDT